jgi:Tol biopolymer transport system component
LTRDVVDSEPDFSPDGDLIVFERTSEHGGPETTRREGVWLMRANGKREHRVPNTNGFNEPVFSPAGDRIAMGTHVGSTTPLGCTSLYTISPDGSDLRPITVNTQPECWNHYAFDASWQPVSLSGE